MKVPSHVLKSFMIVTSRPRLLGHRSQRTKSEMAIGGLAYAI